MVKRAFATIPILQKELRLQAGDDFPQGHTGEKREGQNSAGQALSSSPVCCCIDSSQTELELLFYFLSEEWA